MSRFHSAKDEVKKSPGLAAILTDHDDESSNVQEMYTDKEKHPPSPTTPTQSNPYPWNRDILSGQVDPYGDGDGSVSGLSSVGISSRTGELAIARLTEKLDALTKGFNLFKRDAAKKDADLGNVIYKLRLAESTQRVEIQYLSNLVEESRGHSPSHLTTHDKIEIVDHVLKSGSFEQYAVRSDLSGLASKSDLDVFVKFRDLSECAKVSMLTDYVSATQLNNLGYATATDLKHSMLGLGIPDRLMERFIELEKQVLDPSGLVATLNDSVKELSTKQGGSEVTMGGVSFKDQFSTNAWTSLLGDGDIISYGSDMVVQILGLSTNLATSAEVTKARADAIKAGFTSTASAGTTASFSLPFPETVFRPSQKAKDAARGGLMFAPAFSSPSAFEGDAEFSTNGQMLLTLSNNRERHQRSIDSRFPRDQPRHVRANAVFSAMARLGYFQAVGFLESLLPFHKMMNQAGLGEDEAWTKCLTYARAVFARIFEVRTVASVHTVGSMLYGMMRATQLLQGYGELGWIRHPDVSSALVVAALQKEGKAVSEALGKAKTKDPQVNTNKNNISTLDTKVNDLIRKNPSLNT